MGLMSWLRGGGRTGMSTGTEVGAGDVAPGSVRRQRVDLGELPPIQRVLSSPDLVLDPRGFHGALATRQETALGTPLGHLVSPDAPTGLVHGITTPASVERPSPVQRSVERAVEWPVRSRSAPVSVPAPGPVSGPVQRTVDGGTSAMTSAGESAAAATLPVRHLVGEQTFVPASAAPAPTPTPAPVQRAVTPPVAERPRRAPGLGAPMSALPPTAQRQAAAPEGAAGAVPADRSGDDSGVPETTGAQDAPATPEPVSDAPAPTAPLLGDDPLLPAPSDPAPAPAPTSGPAVQRTPVGPGHAPVPPPPATGPVAPLLADRPLTLRSQERGGGTDGMGGTGGTGGAVDVQRSVAGGGATAPSAGAVPPSPDVVPVRWTSAGAGAPTAPATASAPAAAALQRTVTPPGNAPGTLAPPLPALQRQAVGGPPVPRSLPVSGSSTTSSVTSGSSLPSTPAVPLASAFPTAGSVAVAAGVAQRMADGSVVFGAASPPYSPPVVQRETETAEPPPPEPPQESGPEPVPEPEPEAAPAPGPAAGDHGTPGSPGGPPVVTDELVRALYAPLSRLFKADLRLERERAGFLINTRH